MIWIWCWAWNSIILNCYAIHAAYVQWRDQRQFTAFSATLCRLLWTKTNIRYLKFDTSKSMSCRGHCYWAWHSKTVELLCMPSTAFVFNEEINGNLHLFQQLCRLLWTFILYQAAENKNKYSIFKIQHIQFNELLLSMKL